METGLIEEYVMFLMVLLQKPTRSIGRICSNALDIEGRLLTRIEVRCPITIFCGVVLIAKLCIELDRGGLDVDINPLLRACLIYRVLVSIMTQYHATPPFDAGCDTAYTTAEFSKTVGIMSGHDLLFD
jgi:hypothetical protein